jgi:nucleoside 2-deoxyribosyltransferase
VKLIYVAGPYRGPTREAVELNIATARRVGLLVAKAGHAPVIPHANTAGFEHVAHDLHDEFWLDATMEMMRRCDAVVLCPGWEDSSGTRAEVEEAGKLGIPVYLSVTDMRAGMALPGLGKA